MYSCTEYVHVLVDSSSTFSFFNFFYYIQVVYLLITKL
eukprot:SAG31_NODE_26092_length_448_cov_1.306590_1_plen_37_part_01